MKINQLIEGIRTQKPEYTDFNQLADNLKEAYQLVMRSILGCIGDMPIFPDEEHKTICIKNIRRICFEELGIKEDT